MPMLLATSCCGKLILSLAFAALAMALLLALPTTSSSAATLVDTPPITDLPRLTGITIGDSVADWKDQGLLIHALAGENALLRASNDFQVSARLGWNEEGVLLQVDVTDSTASEVSDIERLYEGDSVDIQLMSADKAPGLVQLVASPGRTAEHKSLRLKVLDYRTRSFKQDAPTFTPRGAVKKTGNGYVMDLLLPWASLKITPSTGTVIGLRVAVNDAVSDPRPSSRQRTLPSQRAVWLNYQSKAEWMVLSPVRLADKLATPAAPTAAWAGHDEFRNMYANVIAEPELSGRSVYVLENGRVLTHGQLARDGARAAAALRFALPEVGKTYGDLTIQLDGGQPVATLSLPDLRKARLDAFLSGAGSPVTWARTPAWLRPVCDPPVFFRDQLPPCDYPEPQRIKDLVGPYTIDTAYFDAAMNRVSNASAIGRYGAVTTVISAAGDSFTSYQTLCRVPEDTPVPATQPGPGAATRPSPAQLLAARAPETAVTEFDALKADRDWWHALRKKLGTAIRYEYFVFLPKGYDQNSQQRWPVIVFLHGSGGGDNPQDLRRSPIQVYAREHDGFPFIVVSLRSPGGWYAPAVRDVIDQIAATCRTDPARYYLTGFSMGAMGTWAAVLDDPDRFAAIAPVGGRSGDPDQAARLKHVTAWVINGADDTTTTSADALKMVRALQAVGAQVKWTDIPNAGHVESHDTAYKWDELYAWFLQHRR